MQFINQQSRWVKFLFLIPLFFCLNAFATSKTILVLGDGFSDEHELEEGSGWVSLLGERLKQHNLSYQIVNASMFGETTSGGVSRLPELLKTYAPEIIVIELGFNDVMRKTPLSLIGTNIRTMIRYSFLADCKVLVLGMRLPDEYGELYARQYTRLHEQITNETNTKLVPYFLSGMHKHNIKDFESIYSSTHAQFIILDNVWAHLFPLLSK